MAGQFQAVLPAVLIDVLFEGVQNLAKRGGSKRFCKHRNARAEAELSDLLVCRSGHEDEPGRWTSGLRLGYEFNAGHLRHLVIADDKLHTLGLEKIQCFVCGGFQNHLMARGSEGLT